MIALEVLSPSTSPSSPTAELLPVASSVPIGQSGLVHIVGRNDASVPRHMGIHWVVKDPDGVVVEDYEDWASVLGIKIELDPDDDHEFIGGRFDLNKEGTYTIAVNLLMNPESSVIVDSYEGDLCTTTTEVPPDFKLLEENIYPYAYIYDGDDEVSIFTFTTLPFTPASWISGILAAHVEDEVRKAGGRVLEMRVYVDESLWQPWTNWWIEVVGIPSKTAAGAGIPTGITWWAAAILAALAIAIIVVLTWSITTTVGLFKRTVGLEDVKPSWGKETLIGTIQDSEAFWERTPTSLETLGGMSEDELREYLDQIAEEEVPLGVDWLPWAIGAGVGVLGIGAVALLAGRKKK